MLCINGFTTFQSHQSITLLGPFELNGDALQAMNEENRMQRITYAALAKTGEKSSLRSALPILSILFSLHPTPTPCLRPLPCARMQA